MIAAILESGEPDRLYSGLSLLVSAAAEGRPVRARAGFGSLAPLLADDLPHDLAALRDTALELDGCRIWACSAAVERTGTAREAVDARLAGVMSMPRFLREVEGADLVFV
jgi:peroxiredoxin family protein